MSNLIEQIRELLPKVTENVWFFSESHLKELLHKPYMVCLSNGDALHFKNKSDALLVSLAPTMARHILEQDKAAEVVYSRIYDGYVHMCNGNIGILVCNKIAHKYCPDCGKRLPTMAEMEVQK